MDDPQDQDHPVSIDRVVHHAVVTDAESVERVAQTVDGLDRLAADAAGPGSVARQLFEGPLHPAADVWWQSLEGLACRWPELKPIFAQVSSSSRVVLPLA